MPSPRGNKKIRIHELSNTLYSHNLNKIAHGAQHFHTIGS